MKNMRKLASLLLALVMVFAMATNAFAATITVNGEPGETYNAYKIFDVSYNTEKTAYTYTISTGSEWYSTVSTYAGTEGSGMTLTASVDDPTVLVVTVVEGTFSAAKFAEELYKAVDGKTEDGYGTIATDGTSVDIDVTASGAGYYFVTTSLGTLCILDTADDTVTVTEKNEKPTVDKKITGATAGDIDEAGKNAIAQVGSTVTYTATINVEDNSTDYVYHDTMEAGLTFSGKDSITVTVADTPVDASNYTITAPGANGETFTVDFDNDYVTGLAADTVISIVYTAVVNSDALHTDPANNTAYLTYGDNGRTNNVQTSVYNATISVVKNDGDNKPLAGAGFVLKNEAGAYYKFTAAAEGASAKVEWVTDIDDATEYKSDAEGKVTAFSGLQPGKYTLVENTVPAGYTQAQDLPFEIEADNYEGDNLLQDDTIVINQSGSTLPETGGMGTTLFYIVGGILVVAAVVLLVTKKRMTVAE